MISSENDDNNSKSPKTKAENYPQANAHQSNYCRHASLEDSERCHSLSGQPQHTKPNEPIQYTDGDVQCPIGELLDREHFRDKFDTTAYLQDFYTQVEDPAMQMVLFFLPNIVARFPPTPSLLDFGAGPTVHVAVCFRNTVEEIYLADYLPQNRKELTKWLEGKSDFDWTSTLKIIAGREGLGWDKLVEMELLAKSKTKGIFHCDCHVDPAIKVPNKLFRTSFEIITSFFTLEYCCNTLNEYREAIRRVVHHIRPGGWLIMGGILEEHWCAFGGRKFKCLFITHEFVVDCLRSAGLKVDEERGSSPNNDPSGPSTIFYEINGMFIICCRKVK
uniref:Uncharacterized protein n=1 Tax=Ditylenchus dipsaci TaxID=166011 RepID=A0A915DJ40_9BILA